MQNKEYLFKIVDEIAAKYNLDSALVKAIIEVESGWDETSFRFEKSLYEKYIQKSDSFKVVPPETIDTTLVLLSSSMGLMQMLGSTARSIGFNQRLSALFNPEVNIDVGCRYLAMLWKNYYSKYGIKGVISAYNGGKPLVKDDWTFVNQQYIDKVLFTMKQYNGGK
jgi:soluble lytic murein transglycosylase-like protein